MDTTIIKLLVPIIVLQVILLVAAMMDLVKRKEVTGGNKILWGIVILCISIIGPLVYFLFGRKEA
ncbi:MAG: PLD nuclease N-terminal domain-containing protein [Limnochordia bacterium]|nr:PLD nuclease N-terminal domain-containing protein [Limnochordia bacterium]